MIQHLPKEILATIFHFLFNNKLLQTQDLFQLLSLSHICKDFKNKIYFNEIFWDKKKFNIHLFYYNLTRNLIIENKELNNYEYFYNNSTKNIIGFNLENKLINYFIEFIKNICDTERFCKDFILFDIPLPKEGYKNLEKPSILEILNNAFPNIEYFEISNNFYKLDFNEIIFKNLKKLNLMFELTDFTILKKFTNQLEELTIIYPKIFKQNKLILQNLEFTKLKKLKIKNQIAIEELNNLNKFNNVLKKLILINYSDQLNNFINLKYLILKPNMDLIINDLNLPNLKTLNIISNKIINLTFLNKINLPNVENLLFIKINILFDNLQNSLTNSLQSVEQSSLQNNLQNNEQQFNFNNFKTLNYCFGDLNNFFLQNKNYLTMLNLMTLNITTDLLLFKEFNSLQNLKITKCNKPVEIINCNNLISIELKNIDNIKINLNNKLKKLHLQNFKNLQCELNSINTVTINNSEINDNIINNYFHCKQIDSLIIGKDIIPYLNILKSIKFIDILHYRMKFENIIEFPVDLLQLINFNKIKVIFENFLKFDDINKLEFLQNQQLFNITKFNDLNYFNQLDKNFNQLIINKEKSDLLEKEEEIFYNLETITNVPFCLSGYQNRKKIILNRNASRDVTDINISNVSLGINLEEMLNLKVLYLSGYFLSSIVNDYIYFTKLEYITLISGDIAKINLKNIPLLKELYISHLNVVSFINLEKHLNVRKINISCKELMINLKLNVDKLQNITIVSDNVSEKSFIEYIYTPKLLIDVFLFPKRDEVIKNLTTSNYNK
ncbi:hypothetical protein ABK040_007666 [Willaertia magna]